MQTISFAPSQICLFDSSTSVRCFRFKTLSQAGKVIRTGNSLEVRYAGGHLSHKGALVMLASSERQFCAYGRITNIIDVNKFNVTPLYSGADGSNVQPVQVAFLNEASCTSWLARALEDENIAGAFKIGFMASRGSRNGSDVAAEMRYIRTALTTPMIVLGTLSSANDLLDTGVNISNTLAAFDENLRQMLMDGHTIGLTNVRPMDLSFGTTPNTAQQLALLNMNIHFRDLARDRRDIGLIDWYSSFVDKTSTAGGSKLNLLVDSVHFGPDGAVLAGKDVAEYLALQLRTKPGGVLRGGLWDGPARGNVVGCNICGALETNASFTPSDTGASGNLSTHFTITGTGAQRTSVSSLIQLVDNDNSYKQRIVLGGNNGQGHVIRIEGPTGDKIAAKFVPGGLYQIVLRYAIYDMVNVKKVEFIADATINYPSLGQLVGNLGAGMSHEGEGPADTPSLYYPRLPRAGVMEFPALIQIPADALSVDAFGINIKVDYMADAGTCTIEVDHPTIRRLA